MGVTDLKPVLLKNEIDNEDDESSTSMEHLEVKEVDAWNVVDDELDTDNFEKPWNEKSTKGKVIKVLTLVLKMLIVLASLYFFICSLSFLSSAFQLLGGKSAGEVFARSKILNNPIIGLMIGVLVTVLVQSSSTSTSIVVAMVSAGIVQLRPAISMVMGANIGTTVTNTIVSLGQSMDRKMFRRAFGGATVHDCFNWLCVFIFLPLEAVLHPLEKISSALTQGISDDDKVSKLDFLKVITKPLTKTIIGIEKSTIKNIAKYCTQTGDHYNISKCGGARNASMMKACDDKCGYLFAQAGLGDTTTGVILLIASLILLCVCLTTLVKTLQSLLLGRMAQTLKKHINSDLPSPFGWLTGYLFILVGTGMTILVQSSSVFTSALTPLVGLGVISLDRMYPLTLGSNIGTTCTAVLAALAATGDKRSVTIQVAISHLLFNIFGILVFYPVPFMRTIPINFAKMLGNTTADYRWFAILYLIVVFLLMPMLFIALSFSLPLLYVVITLIIAAILFITILNILQDKIPEKLPEFLRTWDFLPKPMRSLEPYDSVLSKLICCRKSVDDADVIPLSVVAKTNPV
ncbi:sodium-dependent phosphate transport protein 2B-like isoform X2 [Bolinopsis microptera]|uniref:sodium-dependent phosphate transport protein 2B-like isoform X2 n=1 Tax=Bolinopsis microptera TaxID=2820187 RepID=UPI00307AE07A